MNGICERLPDICALTCCSARSFCCSAILSANQSSLTSSGSHIFLGKLVRRSSTSTNSTSLVYRCGLRKERLDISESLKCFGLSGSCLSVEKCASLILIAGSHGAVEGPGIPQSISPGIGGGLRRVRIRSRSSSAGPGGRSRSSVCSEGIWPSEEAR